MKKITIFDTSILSENIGDFIIMDSVERELNKLFSRDMIFKSITHDKVDKITYRLNKISDYSFIGGTNLLSSNMNRYNQWKINLIDSFFLKNIILMGVGWWQYQKKPNFYTKYLLKSVLHGEILHAVRDSYTEQMLKSLGIHNVINTGCMTMWTLTNEHCKNIIQTKAENIVFTLTDYSKDIINDQKLINILLQNYKKVYFWPQGSGDLQYLNTLENIHNIEVIGANLFSYDKLLEDTNIDLDFIGTRLHAGIRAIQKERRTIIIGIDNRAEEKSKDFNLKVISRNKIEEVEELLKVKFATDIRINEKNINKWRSQFR